MLPKPEACEGCPAQHVGLGYVPGEGPQEATIALVGQGPGKVEAHVGRPFVGPSGDKLRNGWLPRASINPHTCYIDNVVRCWLPGDREPTKRERDFCTRTYLYPTLARLPHLRVVVPLGAPAARALLGREKLVDGTVGAATLITLPQPSPGR